MTGWVVDTSALMAILLDEPDADVFASALSGAVADDRAVTMSAANWLEGAMVAEGKADRTGADDYDELVELFRIKVAPVTPEQARMARIAFRRFGRGSGSPARLNFGDCLAYAAAMTRDEPLLYKGDDFTATDVRAVAR